MMRHELVDLVVLGLLELVEVLDLGVGVARRPTASMAGPGLVGGDVVGLGRPHLQVELVGEVGLVGRPPDAGSWCPGARSLSPKTIATCEVLLAGLGELDRQGVADLAGRSRRPCPRQGDAVLVEVLGGPGDDVDVEDVEGRRRVEAEHGLAEAPRRWAMPSGCRWRSRPRAAR